MFGESETGPYLGAGLGYLIETGESQSPTPSAHGRGVAAAAETGVLFLRDRTQGRIALGLRLTVPLFAEGTPVPSSLYQAGPSSPSFPFLSLSLRFLL